MVASLSAQEMARPMTAGLHHKYGILFSSDDESEQSDCDSSYVQFSVKAGIGATYDYRSSQQHITGHVEQYNETADERQYLLSAFFEGKHQALMRIIDMPTCDNLKVAIITYANENDDKNGSFLQLILSEDG